MKLKILLLILVTLFFPSSQAFAEGYGGGYKYIDGGWIYTNSVIPLSAAKQKEGGFVNASNIELSRLKMGKSYKTNILGLVEIGDAGIKTAAKNGNITKIHYTEVNKHKVYIPLLFVPIYVDRLETVVYGE